MHGYRRAFRIAGSGPVILLIHGIGDNSTTWETVQAKLAQRFTVIAVDLLGHGQSDKPRADYSVAAYANGMRDLLSVLDIERVTVVGHSLGGGVAMQFAYQFPHLVERLVLVGAGGVTKDVNIALRLASLPMGSEALALLRLPLVLPALQIFGRAAGHGVGLDRTGPRPARCAAGAGRPTGTDGLGGVHPDAARGGGLARPERHHAGPMLFDAIRSGADHLGHTTMWWFPSVTPGWHTPRCRAPNWRSSSAPGISRSTTTPTDSSKSSSASSTPPSPPSTTRPLFANCSAPAAARRPSPGPVDTRVAVLKAMGSDERSAT